METTPCLGGMTNVRDPARVTRDGSTILDVDGEFRMPLRERSGSPTLRDPTQRTVGREMPDRGGVLNEKSKAMRGGLKRKPARDRLRSLGRTSAIETVSRVAIPRGVRLEHSRATPGSSAARSARKSRNSGGLAQSPDSIGSIPRSCANLTEPVEIHPREPETGCGCLRAIRNITRQVDESPNRSARSGRPSRSRPRRSNRG